MAQSNAKNVFLPDGKKDRTTITKFRAHFIEPRADERIGNAIPAAFLSTLILSISE